MKIVILASAEGDLNDLKSYITREFSAAVWRKTYQKLKDTIRHLAHFPYLGAVPPELDSLAMRQYRQVICGMNRILYEVRQETVYIHAIIETRRDLPSFLLRRLVR